MQEIDAEICSSVSEVSNAIFQAKIKASTDL